MPLVNYNAFEPRRLHKKKAARMITRPFMAASMSYAAPFLASQANGSDPLGLTIFSVRNTKIITTSNEISKETRMETQVCRSAAGSRFNSRVSARISVSLLLMSSADHGEREFISIVMPVYREAAHIGEVLKDVEAALIEADVRFEIVLIEDGSPDDTWKALVEQSKNFPMMRAARLSRNFGKEHALCAGLEMARGDAVIVMDADGQHPPALLPKIISTWRETGVDIVEGTKIDRGEETLFSKVAAGIFYWQIGRAHV